MVLGHAILGLSLNTYYSIIQRILSTVGRFRQDDSWTSHPGRHPVSHTGLKGEIIISKHDLNNKRLLQLNILNRRSTKLLPKFLPK